MDSFIQNDIASLMSKVINPSELTKVSASVFLPKFKLEERFQLKNILSQIKGLSHIFSTSLDLSRLAQESLLVDDVNHVVITQFRKST